MSPLRVAVRLDTPAVTAWVRAALDKIAPQVDVAVILHVEPKSTSTLLETYLRVDRRVLRTGLDPLAPGTTDESAIRGCSSSEAATAISAADVDLVLDFSTDPQSVLPGLGRLGTFHVRLGSPDIRDLAARESLLMDVFEVDVVARRPNGEAAVLERSISAVDRVSLARTIDPALWKATAMVARCVGRAAAGDVGGTPDLPRAAGSGSVVRGVASQAATTLFRIARRRASKALWRDEWFLAARALNETKHETVEPFRRLPQAANGYRADPFLFEHDGEMYLFFEEFDYDRGLGHLSVGVLDTDGRLSNIEPCLVADHHLSYPGVFAHDGTIFMVPESASSSNVVLYKAVRFPTSWEPVRDLLAGVSAVDPTLHFDGERWWLFASVFERGAAPGDELFLWSSASLEGDWVPHPENPVVSDVRCARPAGMLFIHQGDLIRPAQDGSRGYGSGMTLRRVTRLEPDAYAEETVATIDPSWLPRASSTHTLNRRGAVEVTDGEDPAFRYARRLRRA